jgi:hypothetical protein
MFFRLVADFIDKVLRENASRASAKEPPLSYREAKERWADTLEKRAGYGARPGGPARDGFNKGQRNNNNNGGAAANKPRGGGMAKGRDAKTAAGEPVCYHFNAGAVAAGQRKAPAAMTAEAACMCTSVTRRQPLASTAWAPMPGQPLTRATVHSEPQ